MGLISSIYNIVESEIKGAYMKTCKSFNVLCFIKHVNLYYYFTNCSGHDSGNDCVALQAGNAGARLWDKLTTEDCTSRMPFICQTSMALILFVS